MTDHLRPLYDLELLRLATIRRNAACPCGSGKKYKHCCARINLNQVFGSPRPELNRMMAEVVPQLVRQQRHQHDHERAYGEGRSSQSFILRGERRLLVGPSLFSVPQNYTFHAFLVEYCNHMLGLDWVIAEVEKNASERHPLIWWLEPVIAKREKVSTAQLIIDASDRLEAHAFMSAAYDLYIVAHNGPLQQKLINRLKNRAQFPGAYYELQVIAAFFRAGFDIEFENESDGSTSHHEFTATYPATGQRYSVECKGRNFDYSSYPTWEDAIPDAERINVRGKIRRALNKAAPHGRIIFVDVGYPRIDEEEPSWVTSVLNDVRQVEAYERPCEPFPSALIFFTNNDSRSFSSLDPDRRRTGIFRPFKLPSWTQDWVGELQRNPSIYALLRSLDVHKRIPHEFYRLSLTGKVVEDISGRYD